MGKIGEVREISVDQLKAYERNAKIHNEDQVEKIAASINEFGFLNPCLIDKDLNIIVGPGRMFYSMYADGTFERPCDEYCEILKHLSFDDFRPEKQGQGKER